MYHGMARTRETGAFYLGIDVRDPDGRSTEAQARYCGGSSLTMARHNLPFDVTSIKSISVPMPRMLLSDIRWDGLLLTSKNQSGVLVDSVNLVRPGKPLNMSILIVNDTRGSAIETELRRLL